MKNFKCGFIAVVGKPNSGKSTLINRFIGEKILLVSRKPQSTRYSVKGIKTTKDYQFIFIDTPGLHTSEKRLNQVLLKETEAALDGIDILIYVSEGDDLIPNYAKDLIKRLKIPKILVVNKIDRYRNIEKKSGNNISSGFDSVAYISALKGTGVDKLEKLIVSKLPFNSPYYPEDYITDRQIRFLSEEIIREKAFEFLQDELPYSIAVYIDEFAEDNEKKLVRIKCIIYVEKESQKGIVIGRGGAMLKKIGSTARAELEKFLDSKVYLELFVKVEKNWTKSEKFLKKLGYQTS